MATPSKVSLPLKNKQVEDLLLWVDPKKSGIVLGGATAAFVVLQFARFNVLALTAYALMVAVLGCFIWNNVASFAHKPPVPVPALLRQGVSEQQVRDVAEKATLYLNKGLAYAHRLATGKDAALTGVATAALYAVARVSSIFSIVGLAYTVVLAAFSLPKVYELKKDEIDKAVDTARAQLTAVYDKYLARYAALIPRAAATKPAESSTTKKEE